MKRITAWLMALCLIATCILPVRAMETNGTESPDVMQENEDPDNEAAGEEQKTVPEEGGDTFSNVSPSPSPTATPETPAEDEEPGADEEEGDDLPDPEEEEDEDTDPDSKEDQSWLRR